MLGRHTVHGRLRERQNRGDTLIEVMFAVAVFGLIVVSSLALMNQGTAASQRSVEITTVRQQIDAQAETIRFLQAAYVEAYYSGISFNLTDATSSPAEEFYKIIQKIDPTSAPSGSSTPASRLGSTPCDNPPTNSFVLNTQRATATVDHAIFQAPQTYAQVVYNATTGAISSSRGIWVEGVRSTDTASAGYIDFHIRGCWTAPGVSQPMNIGTIVRLYEPRG